MQFVIYHCPHPSPFLLALRADAPRKRIISTRVAVPTSGFRSPDVGHRLSIRAAVRRVVRIPDREVAKMSNVDKWLPCARGGCCNVSVQRLTALRGPRFYVTADSRGDARSNRRNCFMNFCAQGKGGPSFFVKQPAGDSANTLHHALGETEVVRDRMVDRDEWGNLRIIISLLDESARTPFLIATFFFFRQI